MIHQVYTPVKGLTSGGHFLTYDSLHLTELTRGYENSENSKKKRRLDYTTNASSPSLNRWLFRMALAMPLLASERGKTISIPQRLFT
jgi:hypothetical protein